MAGGSESPSWYRVAHLRPRLSSRVQVTRQVFRGTPWFVLRDPVSGKFSRVSASVYSIIATMDGTHTLSELWKLGCDEFGDEAPSQDELLSVTSQLNALDLLRTDGLPHAGSLARKSEKLKQRGLLMRFLNPLALRFPLFDPNRFLDALYPLVRPLFSVFGAAGLVILLLAGAFTAAENWKPLTEDLVDRVMATQSLVILLFVYPLVKAVHEIGHGLAVKKWGGEVREIGLMFLVFVPVPYVDASAATGFPGKWSRALVGAMGILVEMALASIAMLLWAEVEEGLFRAICFNVMLVGGVSTLLFNGNPLLRFDGYYVLTDILEMPNLGPRANRYLGYLIQKFAFGIEKARSPVRGKGEPKWLASYAVASSIYRVFISFAIVTLVATKFFFLGVLLALWAMVLIVFLPLYRHLRFILFSETLRGNRGRAGLVSVGTIAGLAAAILLLPVPYRTMAEGVLHPTERMTVYAAEAGEVAELLVATNAEVEEGVPIMRLEDPFIDAELGVARANAAKYALRYQQELGTSAENLRLWRAQADRAAGEVALLEERKRGLTIPHPRDMEGRYLSRGDVVGFVVDPAELVVRTAVSEREADLIRQRLRSIDVRPAERPGEIVGAHLIREVPLVGGELASFALSTQGGGQFLLDPRSREQAYTLQNVMHFDLETDEVLSTEALGTRVYVRFNHGYEPLAARLRRGIRQLFLSRFNV